MVPEVPPRRSRSQKEPPTIDLEANPVTGDASADPQRETVETTTVEEEIVEQETASDDGMPVAETAEETQARVAEIAEEVSATQAPDAGVTPADPAPSDKIADAGPHSADPQSENAEADSARTADATRKVEPTPGFAPSQPEQRAVSTTGALAAGILGGLVALAGFGVLQYAGVIPSLGPDQGQTAAIETMNSEIAALKTQVAGQSQAPAVDLSPIEQRLAAVEATATANKEAAPDAAALQASVTALTDEIAALKAGLDTTKQATETSASDLAARLDAAEKKLNEPASDIQLARAIAVSALKTAIDRGGPFLAELDALKSVSPDDPAIAGLQGVAAQGIAPRTELVSGFPDVATAMVDAVRERAPDEGIVSRLINSATSAIRVRPVGSVDGVGPEATIARIEDRIVNGDLKGASLEWDSLPEPAKTAGAAFKTRLDQRIDAEKLVDAAVAGAMTSTPGTPG